MAFPSGSDAAAVQAEVNGTLSTVSTCSTQIGTTLSAWASTGIPAECPDIVAALTACKAALDAQAAILTPISNNLGEIASMC